MQGPVAAARPPRDLGRVHWLGIATLFRREFMRYLRWWFESIGQPILTAVLFAIIFLLAMGDAIESEDGWAAYVFILCGLTVYNGIMHGVSACMYSLAFDKIEGDLPNLLMPPLTPLEFIIGYVLSAVVQSTVTLACTLPLLLLIVGHLPVDPLVAVFFWVCGTLFLAVIGLTMGVLVRKWDQAEAFMYFGLVPLAFLSGMFAPLGDLPEPLAQIARLNPLHPIVDGFRGGIIGVHEQPLWLSAATLVVLISVLSLILHRLIDKGVGLKD